MAAWSSSNSIFDTPLQRIFKDEKQAYSDSSQDSVTYLRVIQLIEIAGGRTTEIKRLYQCPTQRLRLGSLGSTTELYAQPRRHNQILHQHIYWFCNRVVGRGYSLLSHSTGGTALRYAAIASRSASLNFARFSCTATILPPTVSKSGVKPLSR